MLEDLKRELKELSEKLDRKKKVTSMLESLSLEERDLSDKERMLQKELRGETADVSRLERTSITSILYSIMGKKEEQLEKEKRDALSAKLKYDAAVRQLDDCRARIESLRDELCRYEGCEQRYEKVINELQDYLRSDSQYSQRLCSLEQSLSETENQLKEVFEAINAAGDCMNQINSILSSLDSAEGWGTFDILGGGIISDLAKHSKLDQAQAGAEKLQLLLSRFRTELADIKISSQMGQVNVDGMLRFADYFFDCLLTDWCVLSRIHDSQTSVCQVKDQVSEALSQLNSIKTTLENERLRINAQIEELVRKA